MSNQNPYSKASGAYVTTAAETDGRSLEAAVLMKAAMKLDGLAKRLESGEDVKVQEISDIMDFNQKIWQVFMDDMKNPDHDLPQEIKNNIASLAMFVFKRTQEVFIDTKAEKIEVLVNINRNIAAGLNKKPAVTASLDKKEERTSMPKEPLMSADSVI